MYNYHYNPTDFRNAQPDTGFIANLTKAINGEYSAVTCYEQIARKAPTAEFRNIIMEIRDDELRHFHTFSRLYTSMTGTHPQPKITEPCPQTYRGGLEFGVKDEQNTVDFYRDIAESVQDPTIKNAFDLASRDEQHHAVWFLYLLTKTG
ncbi:ferritin-like domain-containing protein [Heyndrickxia acidiproducens]|uniref:ferritin-like domain-containing protein n=1 Tax=Heyndrickxia acidiproducens TaxID=1121084 RepID=UPI000370F950|nr:ferritin-like domain-containing protein [Heyndrickxia acidiproducens]